MGLSHRACRAVSVLALGLVLSFEVYAAEELPAVVVTATSAEQALRDAPASVTVITAAELAARPVADLADALKGSVGIDVGGVGLTRRGIGIRGMSSEHTLVLIDGKRANAAAGAIAHADYDLGWIPVEAIERIEVVRGPMSSLYGSEALGGVVNIITRAATDEFAGSVSLRGGLQEGAGGDHYQAGFYIGGPLVEGKLGFSAFGEARRRRETPENADRRRSAIEGQDSQRGELRLTWTPAAGQRIDFGYGLGFEEREYNTFSTYYYASEDQVTREHAFVTYDGTFGALNLRLRAYRSELERENSRSRGAPTNPQRLTDDVFDAQIRHGFGDWNVLTLGGEWRREALKDTTVNGAGKAEADHPALYIQDEIAIGPDWALTLGNRSDHHESYGWQQSPRAYLIHRVDGNLSLKAGVGRGFKAPTLKQLSPGYSAVGGGGRFTIVGNPDLEPEINTAFEGGFDYRAAAWSVQAMVFQNNLEDLITTNCVAACGIRGAERRAYLNVEKARLEGIEIAGEVDLPFDLRLAGNYTFLQTKNLDNGLELAEKPRHQGAATLEWRPEGGFSAQFRSRHVGRQVVYATTGVASDLPSYWLLSLDAAQEIAPSLVLRGGIQNLTDTDLSDEDPLFSFDEPARTLWLGLEVGF
ncbi:TonB-dependent receptor domain-containing protein [Zavarzinia compransoris]|uniref:TonB-dependent receptor n=1 Tax=Zavarzinia compransoris TaxID=1264899 RepID=A0A317DU88_9PROT|nr:TonB-dependent receptor [Zavarzinia compransoris]PWR18239.1 TonB-dependent receptor [Zavarzinia compransoris]TDP40867.1 outer membrane receptor for ferrienterochelin and colicins [Zavarzinia compransoris]